MGPVAVSDPDVFTTLAEAGLYCGSLSKRFSDFLFKILSIWVFFPPGLANFPDKWYVEVQSVLWPAEKAKELLPLSVGF